MASRGARPPARPAKKRQRRSAEEAHGQILDAADKRLAESGPRGIRLQEIAADVGVSHPTILHHFGSREGLVEAVVTRALEGLRDKIIGVLSERALDAGEGAELVRLVSATLGERGHARLMAWLALEGRPADDPAKLLRGLALAMHTRRVAETGTTAPVEDTQFMVLLVALALFGEGVLGATMFDSAGLAGDATARGRFQEWLMRLIELHLHGPGLVEPTPKPKPTGRRTRRSSDRG